MSATRRTFLKLSAAGAAALVLGCVPAAEPTVADPDPVPTPRTLDAHGRPIGSGPPAPADGGTELSAWIAVHTDETVTITVPEAEMGQGSTHALALVVADELEVPFDRVRVRLADADARFGNQSTGGSSSIRTGHDDTRALAAAAREMLVAAAAARWEVQPSACSAADGAVTHGSETLTYGALAVEAAALPVPEKPLVKPASERRLSDAPRWDLRPKVEGSATFGLDVRVPDMVFAAVARPPVLGQTLVDPGDDSAARAVPGVVDVVHGDGFVAVLARDTWSAFKGRDALKPTWEGGHPDLDNAAIRAACEQALPGAAQVRSDGDVDRALAGAAQTLEATFEAPYLAHVPMEPLSCTVSVGADTAEVWVATQSPTRARQSVADTLGLKPDQVTLHATFLGGGFGRRSNPDFIVEAAKVGKAAGRPVQLVWSRTEDIRGGRYRPFSLHKLRAGVDADGTLVAWEHQVAAPSILASFGRTPEVDRTTVEGAQNLPYAIENLRVKAANADLPVSVWFWRSVGSSQNAWVTECFVDEVAALAGKDPVAFRLGMLKDKPRHARALERAAALAGWGEDLPAGHAHGVAVHESFSSFCAQVAQVSMEDGVPRVHKVTCVLDPGQVVTKDAVEAQVHSSIVYALSAALWGRIDFEGGQIAQSNFHDHRVLRFDEMPDVDVEIIAEGEAFGGVGEPATPPLAPAVCNAIRALTGEPVRSLPLA